MPAVSVKQQRFFGYMLSNPEERKKAGIKKKVAKDFASTKHDGLPMKKEELLTFEAFKAQYKDKGKLSQSSQRKSLGRGSSIKDGAKSSGYESKKEHRDTSKKLAKYQSKGSYNAHLGEAKVDKGRSDYGKASIRNYRRSGPGHDDPAMFDSENKRGKTIDKRREEHKSRRGVKGAKVPAYKVEGTSYGLYKGDGKAKGAMKDYLDNKAKKLSAEKKKQKPEYKNNPAFGDPSHHSNAKNRVNEEGYDRMRDDRLVKYGIGHDGSDRKSTPSKPSGKQPKGKTVYQKQAEKEHGKGVTALDIVKKNIEKKHGKGAIMDTKKKTQKEETLHEISADLALKASKKADVERGKAAAAGDREKAVSKVKQASRLYKASAAKRKKENAQEEYTVTNADKKGNTPAWQGYKSGKKNAKTGKPLYKAADHVKEGVAAEKAKKEAILKQKEEAKVASKKSLTKEGHWEYHEKEGLKRFSDFLSEGNPTTRMMGKSKTQQTGNISADRGTDAKKNKESRKGLEKDLKKKGIGYKKGVGEYKYDDGSKGREVSYQTSPAKGMSKRRFGKVMRRLGRKHGQESVITKDKNKPARLHDTESKKPKPSEKLGKTKPGKHPKGYGETSGTKVRSKNLSKKTNKPSFHYG